MHGSEKTTIALKAEDVLHIPGLGFDGLVGYSPIAMAKNAVGLAMALRNMEQSFLLMERHQVVS